MNEQDYTALAGSKVVPDTWRDTGPATDDINFSCCWNVIMHMRLDL